MSTDESTDESEHWTLHRFRDRHRSRSKHMGNYTIAKQRFLTWLSEQAEKQGTELTIDPRKDWMLYCREPDVLGHVRATTKTHRFQTRDIDTERSLREDYKDRFDRILCVVLQLTSPTRSDHYYPLRITEAIDQTGAEHASGEYQLNFYPNSDIARHRQDDLEFALGFDRSNDDTQVGPSETSHLQEIAQKVCRGSESNNEQRHR